MSRKKLIICGDSWLAPIFPPEDLKHFSYHLGNLIDYEIISFSKPGSSNKAICLQLESAINQNPDLIIFNTTNPGRIEVALQVPNANNKISLSNLEHPNFEQIKKVTGAYRPYITSGGIFNLLESDWSNFKELVVTEQVMTEKEFISQRQSKKEALKFYLMELHNNDWMEKVDTWCLIGLLQKLTYSTIPYLLVMDYMNLSTSCPWLAEKNTTLPWQDWYDLTKKNIQDWEKANNKKFEEPSWHTLPDDQLVMANIIHSHMTKYRLI